MSVPGTDGDAVPPPGGGAALPPPVARVNWSGGYRAAACLAFDVDAESAILTIDPASADRPSVMTHQSYGPLVGVPRLLRILERHDVRATFFVPGYTAVRYPSVVEAIVAAGHEVAHHGFQHEAMVGVGPDLEARILDRGLAALERVAGVRPVGYRAPMWELNWHTPRLLADRGFDYDSSLMDADHPYLLTVDAGDPRTLVELPIHWGLDDWEQYAYLPDLTGSGLIESPVKALAMWSLELTALHAEGGCFILTGHPFLSGRPSRAAVLDELLDRMSALPDLWVAPLRDIATHVRSLDLPPRLLSRPVPDSPTYDGG